VEKLDKHTLFMFQNGYNFHNPPNYRKGHAVDPASLPAQQHNTMDNFIKRVDKSGDKEEGGQGGGEEPAEETEDREKRGQTLTQRRCEELPEDNIGDSVDDNMNIDRGQIKLGEEIGAEQSLASPSLANTQSHHPGQISQSQESRERFGVSEAVPHEQQQSGPPDDNEKTLTLSEASIEKLAEQLAAAMQVKKAVGTGSLSDYWISSEEAFLCKPCRKLSKSAEVPQTLRLGMKANLGVVSRRQEMRRVKAAMKKHEGSSLHIWCVMYEEKHKEAEEAKEKKEKDAGMLVVWNAVFCLKKGLSSEDFVSMNNLNHLYPGLTPAVKNNSRKAFFEIRTLLVQEPGALI
jgi:hypothetical protein